MEYDGFYVGTGKSIYSTPVQIPISKEYDAIGIVLVPLIMAYKEHQKIEFYANSLPVRAIVYLWLAHSFRYGVSNVFKRAVAL